MPPAPPAALSAARKPAAIKVTAERSAAAKVPTVEEIKIITENNQRLYSREGMEKRKLHKPKVEKAKELLCAKVEEAMIEGRTTGSVTLDELKNIFGGTPHKLKQAVEDLLKDALGLLVTKTDGDPKNPEDWELTPLPGAIDNCLYSGDPAWTIFARLLD